MTAHFVHLLDELRRRSLRMASLVEDIVHEATEVIFHADKSLAVRIIRRDLDVDAEEVQVESEVVRLLALYQPVGRDLRLLCTTLKVNNDLERVADCAVNIAERAKHLELQPIASEEKLLKKLCLAVQAVLRNAVRAYGSEEPDVARKVVKDDVAIDALHGEIVRRVVGSVKDSAHGPAAILDVLSVAKNLERIADHATNMAEDVIFLCTGEIVRHRETGRGGLGQGNGVAPPAPLEGDDGRDG